MFPFLDNLSSFPHLVDKIQIAPEQGHRSFKVWHWSLFAASQATITFPNNRWCSLMFFPIKMTLHRLFLYLEHLASIWKICSSRPCSSGRLASSKLLPSPLQI